MKFFEYVPEMLFISTISTYGFYRWIVKKCFFKSKHSTLSIMNIGWMDVNTKKITYNICYYVSLLSFRFFLHHSLCFHLLRWFLQIVNQSEHMSNFYSFHLLFLPFWPVFLISHPRYLFSVHVVKHRYCFPVQKVFWQNGWKVKITSKKY